MPWISTAGGITAGCSTRPATLWPYRARMRSPAISYRCFPGSPTTATTSSVVTPSAATTSASGAHPPASSVSPNASGWCRSATASRVDRDEVQCLPWLATPAMAVRAAPGSRYDPLTPKSGSTAAVGRRSSSSS